MTGRKGEAALDAWSFVHLASGMGLAVVGLGLLVTLVVLVLYEVLEAALRRHHSGWGWFEYESWPNIFADIVVGVAGYGLAVLLLGGLGLDAVLGWP